MPVLQQGSGCLARVLAPTIAMFGGAAAVAQHVAIMARPLPLSTEILRSRVGKGGSRSLQGIVRRLLRGVAPCYNHNGDVQPGVVISGHKGALQCTEVTACVESTGCTFWVPSP